METINSSTGLTLEEVNKKREEYGYNEIPEEKKNPVLKFLSYFWGPIPFMIEIAAILSGIVGRWEDFIIIIILLITNAFIGFWEEHQAANIIKELKAGLAIQARILREGKWHLIPAREIVPGDIVRIRLGDIIPADITLSEEGTVQIDQSALTGESLPVEKHGGELVYSSSIVKNGEMTGIVTATGMNTYFGHTAQLVKEGKTKSHFQKAIMTIGNFLIAVAVFLVIIILMVSLFRGDNILTTLQFALILTIAAIPVALPTVLSVTLAVGARLLGRKKALVSHLTSIEDLAGMDILCSDKTGTLTKNELTVGTPFTVQGTSSDDLLLYAALASREEDSDAIDTAVIESASGAQKKYEISNFVPFDPVHKRTEATVIAPDNTHFRVSKGAPQVILELAENRDTVEAEAREKINEFAHRGFRSLGVASTTADGTWLFRGIIPLFDPPREDSADTIKYAKQMGIQIKMITGDQLAIAKEISQQLGLGTAIFDADKIKEVQHHLRARHSGEFVKADGFAQVFPEHKFYIVDELQKEKHYVGMTGDGVNDAPALKKADVGIAVSGATDAARSAADIVLLTPGLSLIIDAIKESRKIFKRMINYVVYRMTETIRILIFMTLAILIFNFYPVTAIMIILLALLNDGAILSIAYDRVQASSEPEHWNMTVLLSIATILGVAGVVATFGLFYIGERLFHLSRDFIQTLIFLKLAVAGHLTVFIVRTKGPFWSYRPAGILLGAVILTKIVATLIAVYGFFMTPIGWMWAGVVWSYAIIWMFINDQIKLGVYALLDHNRHFLLKRQK